MMTLGIPGSPTAAVLLAGMVIWGLQPRPPLFTEQSDFVWPLIFVLSIVGTYAAYQNMFDVWLMVLFGLGAYLLRILDYPLAPAVLTVVLGSITVIAIILILCRYVSCFGARRGVELYRDSKVGAATLVFPIAKTRWFGAFVAAKFRRQIFAVGARIKNRWNHDGLLNLCFNAISRRL